MVQYDDLAAKALGCLYWSEEQVLLSDLNAMILGVEAHYRDRRDLLAAIFGEGDGSSPGTSPDDRLSRLTPRIFDTMFSSSPRRH